MNWKLVLIALTQWLALNGVAHCEPPTDGLVLWLDATDRSSLELEPDGSVRTWRDKSGADNHAVLASKQGAPRYLENGLNGRPAVQFAGDASMRVEQLAEGTGNITLFVVFERPQELASGDSCLLVCMSAFQVLSAEPDRAIAPFSAAQAKTYQEAWAKYLKRPVQLRNSIGMRFMLIPPGQFIMGSPDDEEWHQPAEIPHRVTITKSFYMMQTEVTQQQWKALMGNNPSFFTGDDLPVETVTWEDAAKFCRKLSEKEGVEYRLPTEAEWEYACRAGTTTPFYTGKTITPDQANYDGNRTYAGGPKGKFRETTTPAKTFPPNAWGLYDMHGNVWEWCADWYGEYTKEDAVDPQGPASGDRRVSRGGCWINFPAVCRSANRASVPPVSWNFHTGFRVVRVMEP